MTEAQALIFATAGATFATALVGLISGHIQRKHDRAAAIEARRAEAEARDQATQRIIAQAKAEAEALKIKTEAVAEAVLIEARAVAEALRLENAKAAQAIVAKVDQVQVVAEKAFTEANHVNMKIADLNDRLLAEEHSEVTGKKLDALQSTADVIEHKVDGLKVKK